MALSNEFAHDKMCTLWEETAETTSMNMTLSKDLEVYNMSDMANKDQTGDGNDTNYGVGGDREYIPNDYRFIAKDGVVTSDSDFQNIIDRMTPVNRALSFNIPASIDAKGLADPARRARVAKGFARDIANKLDVICYQKMIDEATMFVGVDGKFDFDAGIDAETLMLNRGLSAFDRKLFMSNRHYGSVAKELGQASREVFTADAVSRARIPDLATFQTMRSDYLINVAAGGTPTVTVNGDQEHTVATYGADGFYLDNREMTLAATGATAANMPRGTKFTIEDVTAVHPETRADTGELMTFTVLSSSSGSLVISPAIVASGPFQNVSSKAVSGKAITVLNKNADAPSLFYTPESTVIVPGRVQVIGDGVAVQSLTTANGIPMTMIYWYDAHNMRYNMKAVVSMDVQVLYREMLGAIFANQA